MDIEHPEWLQQVGGLLESLNEGVMITDECHRIMFLNSCLEEMIGRASIDMVGRESSQFYTREEFVLLSKEIERGELSGRNRFEFVLPHLDGSRVPVIISARRIEDPDGRTFAIVTFTDISDQKNAEAQLRLANTKQRLLRKTRTAVPTLDRAADVSRFVVGIDWKFPNDGRLHLLTAGRQNASFSVRVNTFHWADFYERLNGGAFLELVKKKVQNDYGYDHILIDSRTGVSDTSGICTVQMPDRLVVCFTASEQSIEGCATVASSAWVQWTRLENASRENEKAPGRAHRISPC